MFRIRVALAASLLLTVDTQAWAAEAAPAQSVPSADTARLPAARQTVDYVFPSGTYARIMNGTMDHMMDSIMDSMAQMPLKDLAGMSGVDTSKLGSATLAGIMEIYDPAFKQRMQIVTRTMMADMAVLMTQFEPDIRDGLAQAYAARFDARQLGEMNAFFATPTGKAYAADSYVIMMSPEVMAKMQAFMPKMMQQMPAIMEKVKTATDALPPARQYANLTEAEKDRLAKLLGVPRLQLDKEEAAKAAARN